MRHRFLSVLILLSLLIGAVFGMLSGKNKTTFEAFSRSVPNDLPAVKVVSVKEPPVIDGKIDTVYTNSCAPMKFRLMSSGKEPKYATTAWVVTDMENLYIAARCKTEDPAKVKAGRTVRDTAIWKDEAIEIFIEPQGTHWELYYHLMVNARGTTQDSKNQFDIAWDPDLTVKCGKEKDAWVMEMKIPFKELGVTTDTFQPIWSFNIYRSTRDVNSGDYIEESAWSPIGDDCSHIPEMFGYLFFDK